MSIYTPPARPRKKPLKAALDTSRVFMQAGWHSDGYLAVRHALPRGIEEVDVLMDGKPPVLKQVIKNLWRDIQAGEYAKAVPVATLPDVLGDHLAPPGERVVLRVGTPKSGIFYLVTKPRLDYVMSYFPNAEIHGATKVWTRALAILGGGKLVGAIAPIMYNPYSPLYSRIQRAIQEAR